MEIEIREIKKQDIGKAIDFAITGMHFNWYLDSRILLKLYGRYFWYLESMRATQVLAAYAQDRFLGVLLAEMKGEDKRYRSFWKHSYVRIFEVLQRIFYPKGAGLYEETTKAMLARYRETNEPDGEIIFLAADPAAKVKGVGTALLAELERREVGKKLYLFTDDACTYQFYEHRGFERACEADIVLDMGKKKVPLKCFIFSKVIPGRE